MVIENVNLIKSIPEKYFTELTTVIMQSITRGRDLKYLKDEIKKRYGVVERRAALIARDQNNKATSIITHTEYEELGITEAIWKHNPGNSEPRHEHVKLFYKDNNHVNENGLTNLAYFYGDLTTYFPQLNITSYPSDYAKIKALAKVVYNHCKDKNKQEFIEKVKNVLK